MATWTMSMQSCLVLLLTLVCFSIGPVRGIARPPEDGDGECIGSLIDYSRVVPINGLDSRDSDGNPLDLTGYIVTQFSTMPSLGRQNNYQCQYGRARMQQLLDGYPVYGATLVATLNNGLGCGRSSSLNNSTRGHTLMSAINMTYEEQAQMETSLNDLQITDVYGKSFANIQVPTGREFITLEEAKSVVAAYFGLPVQAIEATPSLEVYVATDGDIMAYFVDDILVPLPQSTAGLYRAIVDAQNPEVVSVCTYADPQSGLPKSSRRRQVRQDPPKQNRKLQNTCTTCATDYSLLSFGDETTCSINSLYLDDTGKTTICTEAVALGVVGTIDVAGPVASLFWEGTFDCRNTLGPCLLPEIPLSCEDAISDIQYSAIETLKYLQSELNVLGGLNSDASNPQPVQAFAHWRPNYCNAFFRGPGSVYFGDCDCSALTELVTIDIVAHEMMHGVIRYSSVLQYSDQSGGLNEGYADILGCVMEFFINDSMDTPDFFVGEELGGFLGTLRFMEDPPLDGNSIDNIDDYTDGLNVHYSSGILNKAFVTAVRACEANGCVGSLGNCVRLLGNLFLYTNIQSLVVLSTFADAAFLTCQMIPEYLDTIAFTTFCAEVLLAQFVIDGWAAVGIVFEQSSCNLFTPSPTPFPSPAPTPFPSPAPTPAPTQSPTSAPTPAPIMPTTPEPTPSPTPSPTQAPAAPAPSPPCFSKLATIPVQHQGTVPMSKLQVGDYVLTGEGYQPVYAFAHQSSVVDADFLRIHARGQKAPLEISGEHLVYLRGATNPVRADTIKTGDYLQTQHDGALVTNVEVIRRSGLYAPLSPDGTLVVDGIVASCYVSLQEEAAEYVHFQDGTSTMLSQHFMIHLTLAPLRIACLGVWSRLCDWNDARTGQNKIVKVGLSFSDFVQNQPLPVQWLLFAIHMLMFGSIYILEWSLGPQLAALVLLLFAAKALWKIISRRRLATGTAKQKRD